MTVGTTSSLIAKKLKPIDTAIIVLVKMTQSVPYLLRSSPVVALAFLHSI